MVRSCYSWMDLNLWKGERERERKFFGRKMNDIMFSY